MSKSADQFYADDSSSTTQCYESNTHTTRKDKKLLSERYLTRCQWVFEMVFAVKLASFIKVVRANRVTIVLDGNPI